MAGVRRAAGPGGRDVLDDQHVDDVRNREIAGGIIIALSPNAAAMEHCPLPTTTSAISIRAPCLLKAGENDAIVRRCRFDQALGHADIQSCAKSKQQCVEAKKT
jgi:hypothetical protein